MKYFDLDKQEKKILKDFEEGKLIRVSKVREEKKKYQQYAKDTLNKKANINIRLSRKVLQKLKTKAAKEGIPYQTLASSILHRFATK